MEKQILIVIDMQKDFIDGALGTKEAVAIVPEVKSFIESYPMDCIYATKDTHPENYMETLEGKHLPVPHCIKGTLGWEFDAQLEMLNHVKVVEKPTFGSVALVEIMKEEVSKGPIAITLVGLCTDICVVSNALLLKAALPETEIYVKSSACAGVTPETHEAALTTMKMCQIIVE